MTAHAGPSCQSYVTPWHIVRAAEAERSERFALDVAADAQNARAESFIALPRNGLCEPWSDWNWCNPPYAEQERWLSRASWEAANGKSTACLVRASLSARYWLDLVTQRATCDLFVGRIEFLAPSGGLVLPSKQGVRRFAGGEPVGGSNFDSALVFYGDGFAPGVIRWREAKTGRLIDLQQASASPGGLGDLPLLVGASGRGKKSSDD